MYFLSDEWWKWVITNYGYTIAAIPIVITVILKLVAIWNPNAPTDKVREVLGLLWKKEEK
jgi:hypothetical protein